MKEGGKRLRAVSIMVYVSQVFVVVNSTGAQNGNWYVRRPVEEGTRKDPGTLHDIEPPLLITLSLIDERLLKFGLVTGQVGKDAREGYLDQCPAAIGHLKLAIEILLILRWR